MRFHKCLKSDSFKTLPVYYSNLSDGFQFPIIFVIFVEWIADLELNF